MTEKKKSQEKSSSRTNKEEIKKDPLTEELPPFPGKEKVSSPSSSGIERGPSEDLDLTDSEILEPVKNLITALVDLWRVWYPAVDPLRETEKDLFGKPVSRILYKTGVIRYIGDEILAGIGAATIIIPRIKQCKKSKVEKEEMKAPAEEINKSADRPI